jgi:acyl-CoA thioester hydrolase
MESVYSFRVRYAETDQMGTFYNARALEWFEVGRSELARTLGIPYREWEDRGAFLPLVEAHVKYQGRARYDDLLTITTRAFVVGITRIRFECEIVHAEKEGRVASGYTIHAVTNAEGRPMRVPAWVCQIIPEAPDAR